MTTLTYLLSLFDLACTLYLTARFGVDIEANPFGKWLLSDTWATVIFKVAVVGAMLYLLNRLKEYKLAQYGIYLVFAVYVALAVYHIVLIGRVHWIMFK